MIYVWGARTSSGVGGFFLFSKIQHKKSFVKSLMRKVAYRSQNR